MRRWLMAGMAALSAHPMMAEAASNEDYGISDIFITDQEKLEDQRYGGFPNNRLFNNDTPCRSVAALFNIKNVGPDHPSMVAFLRYSRVSLMMIDIATSVATHSAPAVDFVDKKEWKLLPALVPHYCRMHPRDKLLNGIGGAYRAIRVIHGLPTLD